MNCYTLKLRHTGSSNHGRGGEGAMITENLSCTISTLQDQTLFQTGGVQMNDDLKANELPAGAGCPCGGAAVSTTSCRAVSRDVLTYATVCSGIECMSVACIGLPLRPVFFSEIEPFPCAVLKAHYPDVPNLGDMSKIQVSNDGKEITNGTTTIRLHERLGILAGGTPCFVAGTMVLTPKGYVPIETLKVGDEVVSGTGHVRKVEAVGSKMAKVGTLKVLGRPEIICTPNHPFFCIGMKRDDRRKSETYAQMIPVGDYAVSRADEAVGKYVGRINHMRGTGFSVCCPKCGETTCDDIMELAGWYLGDGYIRRFKGKTKKSVVFALCCEKKIARFKERFGGIVNVYDNGEGKLIVNCTALADWLVANFGEHSAEKRIPYWCYDRENTHCLLRGYEATDGWHSNNERKFCTVSPALAYGIADLIGNASISIHIPPPKGHIQGREINQRPCYVVAVPVGRTIRTKFINGRYASIVRSYNGADGTVQRVYNIAVADEHDYIANGLWSHNCQSVSVAGKGEGMREGSGTRSSLAFDFVRLARELRPRWIVWENVANVLSAKHAGDFLHFLANLGDCGYSLAWRVLDAQYVRVDGMERAVPQRRRRVWVVGCLGADESVPAQILFEPDCVAGHTPPRRRAGEGFAYSLEGRDRVDAGVVGEPAGCEPAVARTLERRYDSSPCIDRGQNCIALDGDKLKPREDQRKGGNGFGINEDGAGYTLTGVDRHGVAYETQCYENHAQDSRIKQIEVSDTRNQKDGTGGNNLPLVVMAYRPPTQDLIAEACAKYGAEWPEDDWVEITDDVVLNIYTDMDGRRKATAFQKSDANLEFGVDISYVGDVATGKCKCFSKVSHPKAKDGDGERWDEREVAQTRNTFDNGEKRCQEVVVSTAFKLDSTASNSMKSTNPNSGFHETQVAACLDTTTPDPSKAQGGNVIITTNSNGEDVAATLTRDLAKQTGAQQQNGGGYVLTRREDSALTDSGSTETGR